MRARTAAILGGLAVLLLCGAGLGGYLLARSTDNGVAEPSSSEITSTTAADAAARDLARRACARADEPNDRLAASPEDDLAEGEVERALDDATELAAQAAALDPEWRDLHEGLHDWRMNLTPFDDAEMEAGTRAIRKASLACERAGVRL